VRTKDIERFNHLHGDAIIRLPGVRQTRTFFVLNEVVSTTALPVDAERPAGRRRS
jgi:DNA-binding Lrp family transcriptional regulator